jgi:hypothetical protein
VLSRGAGLACCPSPATAKPKSATFRCCKMFYIGDCRVARRGRDRLVLRRSRAGSACPAEPIGGLGPAHPLAPPTPPVQGQPFSHPSPAEVAVGQLWLQLLLGPGESPPSSAPPSSASKVRQRHTFAPSHMAPASHAGLSQAWSGLEQHRLALNRSEWRRAGPVSRLRHAGVWCPPLPAPRQPDAR